MSLLYHAYVYLEFLILACTIYILAPLIFLYEFICGVLTEATTYIIKKQPFDMYDLASAYSELLEGVSLKKIKEAVLNKYCVEVLHG